MNHSQKLIRSSEMPREQKNAIKPMVQKIIRPQALSVYGQAFFPDVLYQPFCF